MFNQSSMEHPKPFHNNNNPYYSVSKTAITGKAQSIAEEKKKLKEQGLPCKESKDQNNRKSVRITNTVISIDEDADTTQEIDEGKVQEDKDEDHPLEQQKITINSAECVERPTVNLTLPQSNIEHTAEESMTNYKINREKYHSFCQNQAMKEEESRRQRKEKKVAHRKEGEPEEEKRASKSKAWKAEAASTKRMLGSTPTTFPSPEHNSQEAATVITKSTILSMFQLSPTQTNSLVYQTAPGEDPFFLAVFESIKADMQTARIYKLRETNLSKIRTFIVRRVLDDFVAQKFEDSLEQRQHLARHNRRITRVDRSRYLQAGIIEPPSRMKSHYLQQIFQNHHFRDYYIDYLASERLRLYMLATNQEMALKYWQEVLTIAHKDEPYEQKIDLFREIKRKPLFLTQIVEYLEEASMIRIEYCKDKPRKNQ